MSRSDGVQVCLFLALACGNGASGQTDSSNEVLQEPGSQHPRALATPGFVKAPEVAFRSQSAGGPGIQSDPRACVFGSSHEITDAEARDLGFDVDADHALLESEWTGDVLVSRDDIPKTKVHMLSRVDQVLRLDRSPPSGVSLDEAVPPGCPPLAIYALTVQMFTDDGSIAGAFAAGKSATRFGSVPFASLYAESDLRNFWGSLPVARDSARPFFAQAEVNWYTGQDDAPVFYFQPNVWYQDSVGSCVEPLCPAATASQAARLSFGVATGSEMAPFADLVNSVAAPNVSSLTELVAAMGPYHPDVRLWVRATSAESSSVQVRGRIDGQDIQSVPLVLTHDAQILTHETVGGWLDLGELDESLPIEFEVQNTSGLSDLQSEIVMGGCVVGQASNRCAGPGCVARSAASVSPGACSSRSVY